MTLLDGAPSGGEETPLWRRGPVLAGSAALLLLVFLIIFANYREEQAVRRFLTTLQAQEYEDAYQLWQPSASYRYRDFVLDWGEQETTGRFGSLKSWNRSRKELRGSWSPYGLTT